MSYSCVLLSPPHCSPSLFLKAALSPSGFISVVFILKLLLLHVHIRKIFHECNLLSLFSIAPVHMFLGLATWHRITT